MKLVGVDDFISLYLSLTLFLKPVHFHLLVCIHSCHSFPFWKRLWCGWVRTCSLPIDFASSWSLLSSSSFLANSLLCIQHLPAVGHNNTLSHQCGFCFMFSISVFVGIFVCLFILFCIFILFFMSPES